MRMSARQYRFRRFRLDPAARELWKDDELIVLPGSALDCLVYLVEHRERAVGRDELIAAVWGRADVADTLLAQTVLRIRRTLGDSGSDGAIRTVARFGYRWVEETQVEDEPGEPALPRPPAAVDEVPAEPPAPAASPSPLPAPATRRRPWRWIALAAAALVVASLTGLVLWLRTPAASADATGASVASAQTDLPRPALVLPAEVPDAPDWGWLRLGGRALSPSNATLSLVAVGVACGIAGLAWYGLGRSIERGERYVPAVLRDGAVR